MQIEFIENKWEFWIQKSVTSFGKRPEKEQLLKVPIIVRVYFGQTQSAIACTYPFVRLDDFIHYMIEIWIRFVEISSGSI